MATRSAEELAQLRNEFMAAYDGAPDKAEAAFADHLANLDAGEAVNEAAAKASGAKSGAKATGKKGSKAAAPAKPAKAAKEPKAAKPKAFRPTSDDRKALNAAAAKAAGKDVNAPRLLPKTGTYTDFLQGKVLKLDANGNGETTLNVVSAKDTKKVLGTVKVTVTKGTMKAVGAKK